VKHKDLPSEIEISHLGNKKYMSLATWDQSISMVSFFNLYLHSAVEGVQSPNTFQAKKRELINFMNWFREFNGHLDINDWLVRDTKAYLDSLEDRGLAASTVNRSFAILRHCAKWLVEQGGTFPEGLPTKGIKELQVDEPDAKSLNTKEINRLFKAADRLVVTEKRKNASPRRNRAILALLYYTGLRVSELCDLEIGQYDGKHLINVKRKGNSRTRRLYVPKDCRVLLDNYRERERGQGGKNDPLIPVTRLTVWRALKRLSDEASKHHTDKLKIHPHRLRHTFGFEVRKRTGSDTETAALLGHSGLKYVGRYVRRTEKEREEILDDL